MLKEQSTNLCIALTCASGTGEKSANMSRLDNEPVNHHIGRMECVLCYSPILECHLISFRYQSTNKSFPP